MSEHVRSEIQELSRRGNVTPAEFSELRCNSWEFEALVPALTNETLIERVKHAIENCFLKQARPFSTYNEAVIGLFAPELMKRLKKASEEVVYHRRRWEDYEREYILPCFKWAKELGFDLQELVLSNPGKNCVKLLVERLRGEASEARALAETVDNVREALGQKGTHYLVIADDVQELVEAVDRGGDGPALEVLKRLRKDPGSAPNYVRSEELAVERDNSAALQRRLDDALAESARLRELIDTPHVDSFLEAVRVEAAHQCERFGVENDAGKKPQDWFWLLGYLSGKAVSAAIKEDKEKALHHTISSAAVLLNWHAHMSSERTRMRPGIAEPRIENSCQACKIESEIGSEENPHPVPERFHTCSPLPVKT